MKQLVLRSSIALCAALALAMPSVDAAPAEPVSVGSAAAKAKFKFIEATTTTITIGGVPVEITKVTCRATGNDCKRTATGGFEPV